tara:strand:- start:3144 stop:3542 length:399 start_codon:yes stop_codon:yes gene_type:complete
MLRDRTVAFLCLALTAIIWSTPITFFDTEFEGVDNERMEWSCPRPILSPSPDVVDLDVVRAELAETPNGTIQSEHPQCRLLNGTQLVLGLLSLAGGLWKGRVWWLSTSDARAEKKFARLHAKTSGKPKGMLD